MRIVAAMLSVFLLASCGAEPVWAPQDELERVAYRHDGPPSITLYTMVNNASGRGAHTGMMVNASQRVIFDPAGTFGLSIIPERNDVHYGINEPLRKYYETYHARVTYRVIVQTVEVSPEVAELALQLVEQNGATPKSFCANHTSKVLSQLPGFESLGVTFFPNRLRERFARLPGVTEYELYEEDSADKEMVRLQYEAQIERAEEAGLSIEQLAL